MHPANSVIVFTTLSGLGFGLMFWLGLGLGPDDQIIGPLTGLFALGCAGLGLLASTFHLGNPQRFLKAFTQWRSSWLSREGVVSMILMSLSFLYVVTWFLHGRIAALGWVTSALSVLAVCCTAMIYGQLKTVPRWSSRWTVPMFLGFSAAGGLFAIAIASAFAGEAVARGLGVTLVAATGVAYAYRRATQPVTLSAAGSSPETATQLKGTVRLLESPHSAPNYLMKEMVFAVGRKHAEKLALFTVIVGLFAPLFLFVLFRAPGEFGMSAALQIPALVFALMLHFAGALTSRWLFFAEAEHVVGLYYGRR